MLIAIPFVTDAGREPPIAATTPIWLSRTAIRFAMGAVVLFFVVHFLWTCYINQIMAPRLEALGAKLEWRDIRPKWLQTGVAFYDYPFERITAIDFQKNPLITDADLAHLQWLDPHFCIDLSEASITDRGLVNIRRFRNLKKLFLTKTAITDAGLDQLQGLVQSRFPESLGDEHHRCGMRKNRSASFSLQAQSRGHANCRCGITQT